MYPDIRDPAALLIEVSPCAWPLDLLIAGFHPQHALMLTPGAYHRLMLRLLQDLYEAEVLAEEAFTKWSDDVKDQTEAKVRAECPPPGLSR